MARAKPKAARHACEQVVATLRQGDIDSTPTAPTIAIYDRLLARGAELADAFDEVHEKLQAHLRGIEIFLRSAVEIAAYWTPEANTIARSARTQLVEVNQKIAVAAAGLAGLFRQRCELSEGSGFTGGTYHSIRDVIDAAGQGNDDYRVHLGKRFRQLRAAFKRKYWPTLEAIMIELSADAGRVDVQARDSVTAAAIEGQRPSKADYFRAWLTDIEEKGEGGEFPPGFRLTDATMASLATCILDLPKTEIIDGSYVKGVRQKTRRR